MKLITKLIVASFIWFALLADANAVDVRGVVSGLWFKPGTNQLWFAINGQDTSPYCVPNWLGLSMYIPTTDPNFSYYYGLLLASMSKKITIYMPSISFYQNSTDCDITKTGYGFILVPFTTYFN
jgi:hypothetical protein